MLVMMKNTWRDAWPYSGVPWSLPTARPRKTVNSRTLPMIPTGHAHTIRRSPNTADASPNPLPTISRQ
jgi:hypothetical protein